MSEIYNISATLNYCVITLWRLQVNEFTVFFSKSKYLITYCLVFYTMV